MFEVTRVTGDLTALGRVVGLDLSLLSARLLVLDFDLSPLSARLVVLDNAELSVTFEDFLVRDLFLPLDLSAPLAGLDLFVLLDLSLPLAGIAFFDSVDLSLRSAAFTVFEAADLSAPLAGLVSCEALTLSLFSADFGIFLPVAVTHSSSTSVFGANTETVPPSG